MTRDQKRKRNSPKNSPVQREIVSLKISVSFCVRCRGSKFCSSSLLWQNTQMYIEKWLEMCCSVWISILFVCGGFFHALAYARIDCEAWKSAGLSEHQNASPHNHFGTYRVHSTKHRALFKIVVYVNQLDGGCILFRRFRSGFARRFHTNFINHQIDALAKFTGSTAYSVPKVLLCYHLINFHGVAGCTYLVPVCVMMNVVHNEFRVFLSSTQTIQNMIGMNSVDVSAKQLFSTPC